MPEQGHADGFGFRLGAVGQRPAHPAGGSGPGKSAEETARPMDCRSRRPCDSMIWRTWRRNRVDDELPHHRRAQRQRTLVASRPDRRPASAPRAGWRCSASTTSTTRSSWRAASLKSCGTISWNSMRPKSGCHRLDVDLLAYQRLDQPGLALLHDRLGARALADVEEAQAVGSACAVVGALRTRCTVGGARRARRRWSS